MLVLPLASRSRQVSRHKLRTSVSIQIDWWKVERIQDVFRTFFFCTFPQVLVEKQLLMWDNHTFEVSDVASSSGHTRTKTRNSLLKILASRPDQIKCGPWNPFSPSPLFPYCFPLIFLGAAYLHRPGRYFQPALRCSFRSRQPSFAVIVSCAVESSRVFG